MKVRLLTLFFIAIFGTLHAQPDFESGNSLVKKTMNKMYGYRYENIDKIKSLSDIFVRDDKGALIKLVSNLLYNVSDRNHSYNNDIIHLTAKSTITLHQKSSYNVIHKKNCDLVIKTNKYALRNRLKSIEDLILVRLSQNRSERLLSTSNSNIIDANKVNGLEIEAVKFKCQKISEETYKIDIGNLPNGEYCFLNILKPVNTDGININREVYDFSIED